MKNFDGTYVSCKDSGKVCYSGREAGEIINTTKALSNKDKIKIKLYDGNKNAIIEE